MAKINIISNISSKRHAGTPFYILDKKKYKIENDKIVLSIEGRHTLQIGYLYAENTEGGQLINYEGDIYPEEAEEWYLYRVPLLLDGKGKMRKISKTRFLIESVTRKIVNNLLFLLIVLFAIFFWAIQR